VSATGTCFTSAQCCHGLVCASLNYYTGEFHSVCLSVCPSVRLSVCPSRARAVSLDFYPPILLGAREQLHRRLFNVKLAVTVKLKKTIVYLTCSKKLTDSQLNLVYHTKRTNNVKEKLKIN